MDALTLDARRAARISPNPSRYYIAVWTLSTALGKPATCGAKTFQAS